jgi:hypothetical protein
VTHMTSRRMLLGSLVATAGGASAALLFQEPGTAALAAAQRLSSSGDAMTVELQRQLRAALPAFRNGSAEACRQYAATLRAWAAYGKTRNYDGQIRSQLRRLLNERGRAAVIDMTPNHDDMASVVRSLGGTREDVERMHDRPALSRKEAVVDALLQEGLTPALERMAIQLEGVAKNMDRNGRQIRAVAQYQGASCDEVCGIADLLKEYMEVVCALAMFFPVAAELCIAAAGAWMGGLTACALCRIGQYLF